ncbi:MAG: RelA/SpoT family protein [Bacteroides sp.]|nr:RelA/SpoT family protein [Bacteroides sp.]MCM1457782.1 RelA/SpoT family protein [Lachnoclostridium sp.]
MERYFDENEVVKAPVLVRDLMREVAGIIRDGDFGLVKTMISDAIGKGHYRRDRYGINPVIHSLETSLALCRMVSPDRNMVLAVMLYNLTGTDFISDDELLRLWGDDVMTLLGGLRKVARLYSKQAAMESDNFRKLLLTFAKDIRVIIIMIVDRLVLMRAINHHPDEKFVHDVAYEANYLYAPLAHRLGLYKIKGELEDMSLKYTDREKYSEIARKLNQTKVAREAYIAEFIAPIRERLEREGLAFELKGRTKSIYSIWNKMRKQKNDVEDIYDLFAIRIILDVPPEREKPDCWLVYSIVTDMYAPNPARLKDWLSIPKSNGYESLHITVHGPGGRWVEVQIRTRRMDEIAEKGLAAHWKYKGIKSENNLDKWMNNVRDILETAETGPMELMKNFKMDVYDKEVFVFTPRGDLYKMPMGASLLDFAFNIHSGLGCQCTGGRVNGRNQKLNYKLRTGDTVEILTSPNQRPKLDWLAFTVTSKARNKIRVAIKEQESRGADLGKELLQRRFKNRKIELDESTLAKLVKKLNFKTATEFYTAIDAEQLDINTIIEKYLEIEHRAAETSERVSAEEYVMQPRIDDDDSFNHDILVIDNNIKGLNYKFSKCCNPIYGDDVFGFVSSEGVVKIHRCDCPNAAHIRARYPERLIRTQWSGRVGAQFAATLRILGHDDIGIVTNITSIITKEKDVTLRSISIDSNDGLFQGFLVVGVNDTSSLKNLIKKLRTVKGVKEVDRSN